MIWLWLIVPCAALLGWYFTPPRGWWPWRKDHR